MPASVVPVRGLPATGGEFADTAEMARAMREVLLRNRARRNKPSTSVSAEWHLSWPFVVGGDDGTRTHDPLRAKQVL
jgi:hypothetical protein